MANRTGPIRKHSVIILMFLIYVLVWSVISLGELYALGESVYDLGISSTQLWSVFHLKATFSETIYNIFFQGIVYPLSPLSFIKGYQILLVSQSIAIGATCFPLYGIANHFLKEKRIALVVSGTYLIYFPLAGANFFTFHFQSFFPFLFTLGYYLYLKGKLTLSIVLFVVSGMARFPYIIFPFIFSLLLLANHFYGLNDKKIERRLDDKRLIIYAGILMALSALFLLFGYFESSGNSGFQYNLHLGSNSGVFSDLSHKVLTFVLIFSPLLFIPLLSKRWILFYIPFFILVFLANNVFYEYPILFQFQYGDGIIPFVFLGLIDGLCTLETLNWKRDLHLHLRKFSIKSGSWKLSSTILFCTALFALLFEPYGPFNSLSSDNYNIGYNVSLNTTTYNDLQFIIGIIPSNEPYVLFQNNLPELLPRQPINNTGYLIAGYTDFSYNITQSMLQENSFSYVASNGSVSSTKINYAIACMDSPSIYTGNSNMLHLLTVLYESGYYGIRAEAGPIILLERGYNGHIQRLRNYFENLSLVKSWGRGFGISGMNNVLSYVPADNSYKNVFSPIALYPGNYSVTVAFCVTSYNKNYTIYGGIESQNFIHLFELDVNNSSHETFILKAFSLNLSTFSGFIQFPLGFARGSGILHLSFITIRSTEFNG